LSKKEALDRFRTILPKKYHILDPTELNDWIFADYSYKQRRIKTTDQLTMESVRRAVNLQIMESILKNSEKVELTIPLTSSINSKQVKWLFYLSKRFGIFSTIIKTESGIKIFITGPEELVGRREKYGRKIQILIDQIIKRRQTNSDISIWNLKIHLPWGEGKKVLQFNLKELHGLVVSDKKVNLELDFDSKTEEKFYQMLTALEPWEIKREPVVLENNIVFLPDFSLQFVDISILIEVIGFWTEDYIMKKIEKLKELTKTGLKLILVVDKTLDFPKIPPFPTFTYQTNNFNQIIVPLNRYLKKKYLEPYDQKRMIWLIHNSTEILDDVLTSSKGFIK